MITEEVIHRNSSVVLEFLEGDVSLEAEVVKSRRKHHSTSVSVRFTNPTPEQNRHIIEILYSEKNWWKRSKRIGGLDSFLAILSALLRFRPVMTVYEGQSSGQDKI